jgi:PST family polysaccharide transporter
VNVGRRRLDSFLIGYFLGATILGYYTVAARLVFMVTRVIVGISHPVALSVFSRMQQDPERLQRAFCEGTRLTAVVAFPVFLGIAATGPELVAAIYGEQWLTSIPLVQLLALSGVVRTIFNYHGTAIDASGRPSWHLAVKLVSLACDVAAFFLAFRSGIVAIALAFMVSSYLFAPVSLLLVQRVVRFEIRVYLRQLVAPALASLIMAAVLMGCRQFLAPFSGSYIQFCFLFVIGAISYFLVLQVAAPSLMAEMVEMVRSVQRPNKALRASINPMPISKSHPRNLPGMVTAWNEEESR